MAWQIREGDVPIRASFARSKRKSLLLPSFYLFFLKSATNFGISIILLPFSEVT